MTLFVRAQAVSFALAAPALGLLAIIQRFHRQSSDYQGGPHERPIGAETANESTEDGVAVLAVKAFQSGSNGAGAALSLWRQH